MFKALLVFNRKKCNIQKLMERGKDGRCRVVGEFSRADLEYVQEMPDRVRDFR